MAVREEEKRQGEKRGDDLAQVVQPRSDLRPRQPLPGDGEAVVRILVRQRRDGDNEADQAEQPADPVLGHPRRDHGSDPCECQREDHERRAAGAGEEIVMRRSAWPEGEEDEVRYRHRQA
jgi:hypothetical protein